MWPDAIHYHHDLSTFNSLVFRPTDFADAVSQDVPTSNAKKNPWENKYYVASLPGLGVGILAGIRPWHIPETRSGDTNSTSTSRQLSKRHLIQEINLGVRGLAFSKEKPSFESHDRQSVQCPAMTVDNELDSSIYTTSNYHFHLSHHRWKKGLNKSIDLLSNPLDITDTVNIYKNFQFNQSGNQQRKLLVRSQHESYGLDRWDRHSYRHHLLCLIEKAVIQFNNSLISSIEAMDWIILKTRIVQDDPKDVALFLLLTEG